jgi:hypothetical protein
LHGHRSAQQRQDGVRVIVRWIVAGSVALFGAYVCGRAVGILLDVNPSLTEAIAMVLALCVLLAVWARRR